MKHIKRAFALALTAIVGFGFSGCTGVMSDSPENESYTAPMAENNPEIFPVEVEEPIGDMPDCRPAAAEKIMEGGALNGLFADASPETSVFTLYVYDGDHVNYFFNFDVESETEIIHMLGDIPMEPVSTWSANDITFPIYGVEIGSKSGFAIRGAWSNGYWITPDGQIYNFGFDFGQLQERFIWESGGAFDSFASFPCSRVISEHDNGWHTGLMSPSAEAEAPAGIATAYTYDKGSLNITYSNTSGEEWLFGESYDIHVLIDGIWYDVPSPQPVYFYSIGYSLSVGESKDMSYNISGAYGKLPPGRYRLVAGGAVTEFDI